MTGQFLTKRLDGSIYLIFALAVVLTILGIRVLCAGVESETFANSSQTTADADWSELIASMDKMHMAMGNVARSGDADTARTRTGDFSTEYSAGPSAALLWRRRDSRATTRPNSVRDGGSGT